MSQITFSSVDTLKYHVLYGFKQANQSVSFQSHSTVKMEVELTKRRELVTEQVIIQMTVYSNIKRQLDPAQRNQKKTMFRVGPKNKIIK